MNFGPYFDNSNVFKYCRVETRAPLSAERTASNVFFRWNFKLLVVAAWGHETWKNWILYSQETCPGISCNLSTLMTFAQVIRKIACLVFSFAALKAKHLKCYVHSSDTQVFSVANLWQTIDLLSVLQLLPWGSHNSPIDASPSIH